ncbi:MAG: hypothetical protein P0121_16035 [Nitrospira sp.]|nr:hypothetical protein [Nitrospira sp.]
MGAWDFGTIMRVLTLYVMALICLPLAGCSLIESPKEGTKARSPTPAQPASVNVASEDNYMESCRAKAVPVPPDWKQSSSEWESHGNLKTILLTPNALEKVTVDETTFASVWSYASPDVRGACIALGRSDGSFQIICQSATTGYACFWGNDPRSPSTSWNPETAEVPIASLRDPIQGFAPGTVPCTECHRGNNAFLYAPDDPTWSTVLRPEHARPTFTTRVEQSSQHGQLTFGAATSTYPRFIPVGGKSVALNNPLPTTPGCSGSCHESHFEILEKNHTVEGYVRIPRPMGPNCAADSPPDDPTRNCYQH